MTTQVALGRRSVAELKALVAQAQAESANWTADDVAAQIAELGGLSQLLVFDAAGLKGLDLTQGQELWSFPWTNGPQINVAQPIVIDPSSVLIGTGYGTGSVRLQITRTGDQWTVDKTWTTKKLKPKFNGMVRLGDAVYGLDDGVLACVDLQTGKQLWKAGRYGYGQLLLAGQTLIVLTEAGEIVCLEASPREARELGRFQAISGIAWNQLQLVRGLWLMGVSGLVVLVSSPLDAAGVWVMAAPAGLLAVLGSLVLFGMGTAAALTKHRWHKPATE